MTKARKAGRAAVVVVVAALLAMVATAGPAGAAHQGTVTATPDPLQLGSATYGGDPCTVSSSEEFILTGPNPRCSTALVTVTNDTNHIQTIDSVTTDSTVFSSTGAGTCRSTYGSAIPRQASCTVRFWFGPDAAGTSYTGTGTITFSKKLAVSFALQASSNP